MGMEKQVTDTWRGKGRKDHMGVKGQAYRILCKETRTGSLE